MKKNKAIVLISGGMDSLVTAAIAAQEYSLAGLHLNYGQRTEKRELKAFRDICGYYGIKERLVTDITFLAKIGGSALTDKSIKVPKKGLRDKTRIPITYVPFRNTHIIAIAVSWAEVIGARRIFIGAVQDDSSGYPDCRKEYFQEYNRLIEKGTKPGSGIRIETPIIGLTKAKIVQKGIKLKVPFQLSWSCYQNEDRACGDCDSCRLRLKGFKGAGIEDPIKYRI
jgi:7-cyano-7-deazaguanine synthase